MGKYDKKDKYVITHFDRPVPCPYSCGQEFVSSLQLARHVLQPYPKGHNWNQDYKEVDKSGEKDLDKN